MDIPRKVEVHQAQVNDELQLRDRLEQLLQTWAHRDLKNKVSKHGGIRTSFNHGACLLENLLLVIWNLARDWKCKLKVVREDRETIVNRAEEKVKSVSILCCFVFDRDHKNVFTTAASWGNT